MYQLIGKQKKEFSFQDGNTVSGYNLFLTEERSGVEGYACERIFVSDQKLTGVDLVPGDRLEIVWNRFGKPQEVRKL